MSTKDIKLQVGKITGADKTAKYPHLYFQVTYSRIQVQKSRNPKPEQTLPSGTYR